MDRENKGRKYTGDLLERTLSSATNTATSEAGPSTRRSPITDSEDEETGPGLGDIVAVVLPGSTVTRPLIELGKVIHTNENRTKVRYIILTNIGGNNYHGEVGRLGRAMTESVVYPIDFTYKKEENTYQLLSTTTAIHLKKFPST